MAYFPQIVTSPKSGKGGKTWESKGNTVHLKGLSVVETPLLDLLRSDPAPPWQQQVRVAYGAHSPKNAILCSDFWSNKMRKRVINTYLPNRTKSKVAASFHSHDRQSLQAHAQHRASIVARSMVDLPKLQVLPSMWTDVDSIRVGGRRRGRLSP